MKFHYWKQLLIALIFSLGLFSSQFFLTSNMTRVAQYSDYYTQFVIDQNRIKERPITPNKDGVSIPNKNGVSIELNPNIADSSYSIDNGLGMAKDEISRNNFIQNN